MKCDTASLGKDWYLIAINPWQKWYWNPTTDETRHIPHKEVK